MMGRAGRPQYDSKGVAVIMVHEPKKAFYKRFLYEPFPVESSLADQVSVGQCWWTCWLCQLLALRSMHGFQAVAAAPWAPQGHRSALDCCWRGK